MAFSPCGGTSKADLQTCSALQKAAAPWNTTIGKFDRFSQTAMVTPAISGIRNKDALQVCCCHRCLLSLIGFCITTETPAACGCLLHVANGQSRRQLHAGQAPNDTMTDGPTTLRVSLMFVRGMPQLLQIRMLPGRPCAASEAAGARSSNLQGVNAYGPLTGC
jgi:hypothetical protein